MNHFFKKTFSSRIITKLVSGAVAFSLFLTMVLPLRELDAQVDAIGGPFQIFSTVYNEAKQIGLDTVMKQAAISMANKSINSIIDSTAKWAGGGFSNDEKPKFLTNPGEAFLDVADSAAQDFFGKLQGQVYTGSVAWLEKVANDSEAACSAANSGGDLGKAFIDYLYGLLNPGMQGDDATGTPTPGASLAEIQTWYDANEPVTAQKVVTFASSLGITLQPNDIQMSSSSEVSPNACKCADDALVRYSQQKSFDLMSPEERATFFSGMGANITVQSYLDEKYPIKSCIDFQNEDGNQPDFIASGGYTRGIIQFLGSTYKDPKGTIGSLAPNYEGLPKDIQKQVSQNWTKFASSNGSFSAGGWNSWNQISDPRNNPIASRFLFKNALQQQAAVEVRNFKEELQQGNGFVGAKTCAVKEVLQPDGSTKCPTGQLITNTPGSVVSDQLSKALGAPLVQAQSVDSWEEVLQLALARLGSKLLTTGVTAIANEAGRQMDIANGAYSGLGGNILAKSSTTNNGAGTGATEILDLEAFFLGDPVRKIKKDAAGQPMYEPVIDYATGKPQVDATGNIVYDKNKPVYVYEQQRDGDGKLVFETKVMGLNGRQPPDDPSTWNSSNTVTVQVPVYDLSSPVYEDGFELALQGGKPFMEETPKEDHSIVTISSTKIDAAKTKLTISSTSIDLAQRYISWKDLRGNKVIGGARGLLSVEDVVSCPIGGCHNTYEVTITKNDGSAIYKLISVWRNLKPDGTVEWKSESSGTSEPAPSSGELQPDYSKPLYQKDDDGKIVYESKVDATGAIIKDAQGNPIPDTTKPKRAPLRRGGALARTYYMNWILSKERESIRQLPQAAKALDQCIPGPDYGWDKRLQTKYDRLTQKYGGKKPENVNQLLIPLKEIGQAVYTIMSSYEEGTPPDGCTGSSWVPPRDHELITIMGEKENAGTVKITLMSNQINLGGQSISWKYVNWSTNVKDKTDDGVASITKDLKCPPVAGDCKDIYEAEISLADGSKIFKRIKIWRYLSGTETVWQTSTDGWSEGVTRGVGQSIYNLTGNPNNALDCSDITWYQQYNGAGFNWGFLGITAKDMQNLAGYELTDTGEIWRDSNGDPRQILNIPSADDAREVFNSAKTKYSRKYKQVAEQQGELSGIKKNLDKLYEEYTDGSRDKNLIARDVGALREDLPFKATIDRERLFLEQILEDIDKIYETTQTCWEEKSEQKYYDIYFKDEMQVLYCPLQFHGKMNVAPRVDRTYNYNDGKGHTPNINWLNYRNEVLKIIGKKPQKDLKETLKSMPKGFKVARYVYAGVTGGVSELLILYYGNIIDAFSNTTAERYASWLAHPKPLIAGNDGNGGKNGEYMCWETSYEEDTSDGGKAIDTGNDQCPGQSDVTSDGNQIGQGKFAVERLQLLCKDFYKSTLTDYNELFGITQNNTLP